MTTKSSISIPKKEEDNGTALEQREEVLKLRAKLKMAEQARLAGGPTYTLEESRKRLEAIYQRG